MTSSPTAAASPAVRAAIAQSVPDAAGPDWERFFALSPDLLCVAGFDGAFQRLNPAWEALAGCREADLLGRSFCDFVHPDDRARTAAAIARLTDGAPTGAFENRCRSQNGTYRLLHWHATADRNTGRIYALARVGAAEHEAAAVRDSEERFRIIFERAGIGIGLLDLDRRFIEINHALEALLGYRKDELRGQSAAVITEPEDVGRDRALFAELVAGQRSHYRVERRYRRKDGETVWATLTMSLIHGAAGEPSFVLKIIEDIGVGRRAELLRSQLAAQVEASDDAIIGRDGTDMITSWNPSAERLFGYSAAEIVGQPFARLVPPAGRAALAEQLTRARQGPSFEAIYLRQDGQAVEVGASLAPVADTVGNTTVLATVIRDITARKRAEREIRQLNTNLQEAVKELDAFSYSISHDLRAPLRAVNGFANAVLEDYGPQLDAEGQRYLRVIGANALLMGQLIDDLLAFSRLGRHALATAPVDLTPLARAVFAELAVANPDRALRLDLAPLPPAYGDHSLLRQVLVNLIGNAVKFTGPRTPGVITVRGAVVDGLGHYTVADNGVGFDMAYVDKIFGVFQRLHSVEEFAGTGVGLALVQRIIQRHGGQIWAEGRLDAGTIFTFTLPHAARLTPGGDDA